MAATLVLVKVQLTRVIRIRGESVASLQLEIIESSSYTNHATACLCALKCVWRQYSKSYFALTLFLFVDVTMSSVQNGISYNEGNN